MVTPPVVLVLPFDIWEHIAQYVPDDQLEQLYPLNRSLFQLAMSIRYRKLLVGDYLYAVEVRTSKWYRLLKYPHLVHYVRSLTLEHTNLVVPQQEYITSDYEIGLTLQGAKRLEWLGKVAKSWLSLWLFCDTREGRDHKALNLEFAMFFSSLTQLTSLTIKWDPFPSYAPAALDVSNPMLSAGWKALGRNLRTLEVQMQLDYLPRLLTTSLHFEQLENFIVTPQPVKREKNPPIINSGVLLTTLVPFVNRHSNTLISLAIGWKDFELPINVFSSFKRLRYLRRFTVSGTAQGVRFGAQDQGLEHFLVLNSGSLVDVHWRFSPPQEKGPSHIKHLEEWFNQPSYNYVLPNLKKLTLSNPTNALPFKTIFPITSYIGSHTRSLTCLTLLGIKLDQNSLLVLKEVITPLIEFSFATYVFTVTMLTTLAMACPHLKTLKLDYTLLGRQNPGAQLAEYSRDKFAKDLESVLPIKWGVKILFLGGDSCRYDQEGSRRDRRMLAGALLNAETINGESRATVLAH